MQQNYVGSLLDVVDGGVRDTDTINVQLDRVANILATDVNNTDISAQMEVSASDASVLVPETLFRNVAVCLETSPLPNSHARYANRLIRFDCVLAHKLSRISWA
jgi:hypothetical protein